MERYTELAVAVTKYFVFRFSSHFKRRVYENSNMTNPPRRHWMQPILMQITQHISLQFHGTCHAF